MSHVLLPFSWLYGLVMFCRNKAFDVGLLQSEDVGVPVISVGNMTMGGTGKTPLVEYVVGRCLEKGRRVAVVSRGYKRNSKGIVAVSDGKKLLVDATEGGDEPVQIAIKYPQAPVVVGERRVGAAQRAVNEFRAEVIVMDDGFQHRYLHRGLDIVVLDSRKDLFRTPLVPAGERRELMSAIKRAHVVALSRSDEDSGWWNRNPGRFAKPMIRYRYKIDRVMKLDPDGRRSTAAIVKEKLFVFSGIGDHLNFLRQMGDANFPIVGDMRFPDHHQYTRENLGRLQSRAAEEGASALLTTEKDAARLSGNMRHLNDMLQGISLFSVGIVVDIVEGREVLDSMIDTCLSGRAA